MGSTRSRIVVSLSVVAVAVVIAVLALFIPYNTETFSATCADDDHYNEIKKRYSLLKNTKPNYPRIKELSTTTSRCLNPQFITIKHYVI